MADPRFYDNAGPLPLAAIMSVTGARAEASARRPDIADVAALEAAGLGQLSYCDSPKFKGALASTRASAILVSTALAEAVPAGSVALICDQPAFAFAKAALALYPLSGSIWSKDAPPVLPVHPTARVGEGTVMAPGVFLGPAVELGRDCIVGPGAVIGRGVQIGHGTRIGAHASVSHALVGDRVTIHPGARIGQDGFGFIGSPKGHCKIPQLGRVIIQDDVEIGANVTIDRGALGDTVIGEGTKIDNLVQIGHNTRVGRHCIIVAQVGISGSCSVGDFAVLGGQVGVADHLSIGAGAQVAAKAGVTRNLEGGRVHGGFPAKPVEQWRREVAALSRLAKGRRRGDGRDAGKD
jgi:UDP-3-O-[3-hydroxymyristoyl] glucosamine N-acyltransferase